MKVSDYHLGFIGFGHMAQVIFKAIDRAKLIPHSQMSFIRRDRDKMKENEQEFGITSTSLKHLAEQADIIILGVRPAQAKIVLEELKSLHLDESKLVISVLAGVNLSYYRKFLKNPILRVMPNIASDVGMGMSVFTYTQNVSNELRSLTNILFSCMGEIIEVPENLMDISCGIAGSGPGFVFRLIQAMAREGEKEGLKHADALKMAAQTFMGAAKLVLKKANVDLLLQQIATPNGTTEAGLKMITSSHLDEQFRAVVAASAKRSKELSEEFQ
jgi:pyrroline-5-carboxylate reductase